MPTSTSSLDPKVVFASCYREGPRCVPRCIGYAESKTRRCNNPIGKKKMEEHDSHMARLNSLPLQERTFSPLLLEATSLLLCYRHIDSYLSGELENARQRFRDAASEEARKEEEEETKQQIEDQQENGVTPAPPAPPAPPALPTPPATPTTRALPPPRASLILPATLQIKDEHPSESDSESDSDSDSEDKGTGTVDPWTAYQARWKEVMDSSVREGTPLEYQIPWPVVSSHLADVDHVQVGHFFNQAVKGMNSLQTGKTLYYELDRWQRSSLKKRFGRSVYRTHKPQFKLILTIVREGTEKFWNEQ